MTHPAPKFALLVIISVLSGWFSMAAGLSGHQALSLGIFIMSVMGTLFFWEFRLSFAFLGTGFLLIARAIDLDNFLRLTTLEVILFLVGMMVIVAVLKDTGFFVWLITLILRVPHLTGRRFTLVIILFSAILASLVDEVTSIIFMVAAILEVCDYYEVKALPFVIISVLATNIGSAATVLGNPIGIVIATKAHLSFGDFIVNALPLSVAALGVMIVVVLYWYRREIASFDERMKTMGANDILIRLIAVPMERSLKVALAIFAGTLTFIAFHRRIEESLQLTPNTILLIMPLMAAGAIMIWKPHKAREYVERGVEWWTLLFFMLLFAQAGTLKFTGATDVFAGHFMRWGAAGASSLTGLVLWLGAIGSSILDNVIIVVTFASMISSFFDLGVGHERLWWALLMGGCLGGNITLIGSTANIVALGILEKEHGTKVRFRDWFGVGLTVGVLTTFVVWLMLLFLPMYR